jgi:hypothetical protein
VTTSFTGGLRRAIYGVGALLAAGMFLSAFPASADPVTGHTWMIRQDKSDCSNSDVSSSDPARVGARVSLSQTADGTTTVVVNVSRGTPKTTYNFELKCVRQLGAITTDGDGVGEQTFTIKVTPNTPVSFDMYPTGSPPGNVFQSARFAWQGGALASQKQIAQKYAPLVWLNNEELWMPSSIDYYAQSMDAVCDRRQETDDIRKLTMDMLPPGRGAPPSDGKPSRCFFHARPELRGPYSRPVFLRGQDPSKTSVPIYVFIYQDGKQQAPGDFDAQYMTFYPYNFGKEACIGFAPKDHCAGARVVMGNHVADWELMTIRFENGKPVAVHTGSHGNNIPKTGYSFFAPGWTKSGNVSRGPTFGEKALGWEGDHPIVYSAGGSHGTYGWAGTQNYETTKVGDKLNDYTSQGTRWQTWQNIVWSDDNRYNVLLNQYEGRWGDPHLGKSGCDLAPVPRKSCDTFGIPENEYQLNDGPSLPDRQRDKDYMYK